MPGVSFYVNTLQTELQIVVLKLSIKIGRSYLRPVAFLSDQETWSCLSTLPVENL